MTGVGFLKLWCDKNLFLTKWPQNIWLHCGAIMDRQWPPVYHKGSSMRPLGGVVEVHNLTILWLPSAHQIFTHCIHICVGFDNSTSIAWTVVKKMKFNTQISKHAEFVIWYFRGCGMLVSEGSYSRETSKLWSRILLSGTRRRDFGRRAGWDNVFESFAIFCTPYAVNAWVM